MAILELSIIQDGLINLLRRGHDHVGYDESNPQPASIELSLLSNSVESSLRLIEETKPSMSVLTNLVERNPEDHRIQDLLADIEHPLRSLTNELDLLRHVVMEIEMEDDCDEMDWTDLVDTQDDGSVDSSDSPQEETESCECAKCISRQLREALADLKLISSSYVRAKETESCEYVTCLSGQLQQAIADIKLIASSYLRAEDDQVQHRDA